MQINEMNKEEVEARLAEITSELETRSEESELEALKAEVVELQARKAELEEAETRSAQAEQLNAGEVVPEKIVEEKKDEVRHMELTRESAEYRSAWLKSLQGKVVEEAEQRAIAASGAAVPTQVADKFFEKMKKLAPMLSEITLFQVAGNLKFMAESVRDVAAKHTENASITAGGNDAMVSVTLGGFEFAKLISISKAASAMSIDAFEGWLVDILSGDLARAVDDYIINDSTNGIAAVTYTTGDNQILNTATTGYTYKNIVDLIALLPAAYDAEAKFLVNKATLYGEIANICDSQKRPIFVESPEGGLTGRIMGYPVLVDDYVTKTNNAVYLGRWADIVGNFSEGVSVERDDHSGFRSGSIDFRGFCVFDSKPAKTDGIVRLVSTTA